MVGGSEITLRRSRTALRRTGETRARGIPAKSRDFHTLLRHAVHHSRLAVSSHNGRKRLVLPPISNDPAGGENPGDGCTIVLPDNVALGIITPASSHREPADDGYQAGNGADRLLVVDPGATDGWEIGISRLGAVWNGTANERDGESDTEQGADDRAHDRSLGERSSHQHTAGTPAGRNAGRPRRARGPPWGRPQEGHRGRSRIWEERPEQGDREGNRNNWADFLKARGSAEADSGPEQQQDVNADMQRKGRIPWPAAEVATIALLKECGYGVKEMPQGKPIQDNDDT